MFRRHYNFYTTSFQRHVPAGFISILFVYCGKLFFFRANLAASFNGNNSYMVMPNIRKLQIEFRLVRLKIFVHPHFPFKRILFFVYSGKRKNPYPADTQRQNDVVWSSKQRWNVKITLFWRHVLARNHRTRFLIKDIDFKTFSINLALACLAIRKYNTRFHVNVRAVPDMR